MAAISGYRVDERVHDGGTSIVYRGTRVSDGTSAIIKALKVEYPPPRQVAEFRKEYAICCRLAEAKVDGVARPVAFHGDGKDVAMVFEFLPGVTLESFLDGKRLSAGEALPLARRLASILGAIHREGIVHKDVKPSNIIIDPETMDVCLIDFGISSALDKEEAVSKRLEGSIAYMSPEQTGRMNRPVDYRTDFYSLGVTLYQMLCGQLPFAATDPLEMVHAHIALEPTRPSVVNHAIPAFVSDVVMKLLAKTAEARYQSASGVVADLEDLHRAIQQGALPESFEPGRHDVPDRFQIPVKLYGRTSELARLLDAFGRAEGGSSEMLFVSGYSGIGKSALIHEIHKPIVKSRGYFISGKFDQFKRNIPYASMLEAFRDLVSQLLTESEDAIARWRRRITEALGPNGAVATSVLPELELIIGEQPPVPELSGEAAQNRLNRVFLGFIRLFAHADHPLVLFLDDLQWADRPTLNLLRILVTENAIGHLLVIGCYRDNEVDDSHPFVLTLRAIEEQRAIAAMTALEDIHLQGLDLDTLSELVGDCVHSSARVARPLAELIHGKTLGNPFFVNQFLRTLHRDGLIRFGTGAWTWNVKEIESRDITDNVVELMTGKIEKLSARTQEALRLAAAIGNVFELAVLAGTDGTSVGEAADALWEALGEGYVVPLDDGYRLVGIATGETGALEDEAIAAGQEDFNPRYRFLHDRVQQAAYSLIPAADREETHLRIGRAMLALTPDEEVDDTIFNIVDQLEHGIALVTADDERLALARLFLRAGEKARLASAHEPAIKYFEAGRTLLGDTLWTSAYAVGQPLMFQLSGSRYLAAEFDAAELLFDELVANSRTDLEKAQVYRLKLSLYQSRGLFKETVEIAYAGLAHLGVNLPRDPTTFTFVRHLMAFKWKMRGKTEEDLKNLPHCTDPRIVTAIDIMNDFSGPAFFIDINIYLVVVLTMCSLSLEHGNAAESAYCWTLYGMMNGPIMGNVPHGMELGRVGEHVDSKHAKASLIPKVQLSLGGLVYQWGQHPRLSIPYFERGFQAALESGDPTHAGYCANFMMCMFSVIGEPLDVIEQRTTQFLDFARKNQIEVQSEIQTVERQMARSLMARTASNTSWSDADGFDEDAWLARARDFDSRQPLHNYLIEKQATLYLLGEYEAAVVCGDEAATMLDVSLGIPIFSNFHLYYGLTNAQLAAAGGAGRGAALKKLKKMLGQHGKWAKHNPDGFEHKHALLAAEYARVTGKESAAAAGYDAAIRAAEAHEFQHHGAIANELAGRFYLKLGRDKVARTYLREARHAYLSWGADAVVARMDDEYPELAFGATGPGTSSMLALTYSPTMNLSIGGGTLTRTRSGGALDLHTILRASQVISGEIVLADLLQKLLTLVIENAGARRAVLILDQKGEWVVQAEGRAEQAITGILDAVPLAGRVDLAHGVINYVTRTKEPVVLDDVSKPSSFSKDDWIASGQTKSILASPILQAGNVVGVIYLENDLTTGVFTGERLELLRLLSAQIAISIENASLYRHAEQMANAFARFVPKQFLTHLGKDSVLDVSLGDAVQRDMTVLFSDIRSFTAISEQMSPRENMAYLNDYMRVVGPVIRQNGGFIDKYIGDAVMALFPRSADDAINAAIAMHARVEELNARFREERRPEIKIGVGLHHGSLMLGTIGESERMDSTVISDVVNTASRLEGLTKAYGAPILITGHTLDLCDRDRVKWRYLGDARPRGRASHVSLYEIYEPLAEGPRAKRDATRDTMHEAMQAYVARRWTDARRLLVQVLSEDPEDPAARAYLERVDVLAQSEQVGTSTAFASLDVTL